VTRPTASPAGPGQTGPTTTDTAMYEIRVAGHLDDHWAATLGDLTLVRLDDGTTSLTGPLVDQAQLHGVLTRIRDLGVPLLMLHTLDGPVRPPRPGLTPDPAAGTRSRAPDRREATR
jgi:hypothetical protein